MLSFTRQSRFLAKGTNMLQSELKVGGIYRAKVAGKATKVKLIDILNVSYPRGAIRKNYLVLNLKTNREIRFRSAQKFIAESAEVVPSDPEAVKPQTVWVYFSIIRVVEKHVGVRQFSKFDGKELGWKIVLPSTGVETTVNPQRVFTDVGAAVRYGKEQVQGEINELIAKQKAMDELFEEPVASEQRACEDSPNGEHEFTPDLEYDPTGETINCLHCGKGATE